MKTRVLFLSVGVLISLTGCGQKGPSTSAQPETTASASATQGGGRTIEITANDQMKFNITSITAKPGEELRVVLSNTGTIPKEAMGHNWVLLKSGVDPLAFGAAAAGARETDYVPQNLKDQVIAVIGLLGPKQKGEVSFKAPEQPGDYPFVCTFPGHAALMKGVLTVK